MAPYLDRGTTRWLAGGEDDALDYSVLAVAVTTLGLILCVELVRHSLDVKAVGRPFFKTVLEGVYRELATLGIVEFFIFLFHKYYKDLNVAQEKVFADVHFTLFYTALLNAFQSVILAFFVIRTSNRLWVQTEYQDLHHYVEIREEFDRIDRELYWKDYKAMQASRDGTDSKMPMRVDAEAAQEFEFSLASIKRLGKTIYENLQHPIRSRKHNTLLIQIRFHELKYHFIQAHNLPITFNVSDYLKRSELQVLTKLVHISTFAWLLVTGGVALVYFFMGITVYVTDGNHRATGTAMTVIFFLVLILFVLISLLLFNKMKKIFRHIMHMKLITHGQSMRFSAFNRPADVPDVISQKELFWGGSPTYIIICIQFMQFGFAVFLAILLVFWENINADGLKTYELLVVLFVTYVSFVAIMTHVIPRYTMCSSLGQLVNHRRLHETLARHRLDEAQRRRKQQQDEGAMYDSAVWGDDESTRDDTLAITRKGMELLGLTQPKLSKVSATDSKSNLMWELTMLDTKDLRKNLPKETQKTMNDREQQITERRSRRKSVSDGVASMRSMMRFSDGDDRTGSFHSIRSADDSSLPDPSSATKRARRKEDRLRSVSASASIEMMRDYTKNEDANKELPSKVIPLLASARRNRRRAVSAQANIIMMRNATIEEETSELTSGGSTSPTSFPSRRSFSHPELQHIAECEGGANHRSATARAPSKTHFFPTKNDTATRQQGVIDTKDSPPPVDARVDDETRSNGQATTLTEDGDESDDEDVPVVDEAQRERAKAPPKSKPTLMDYVLLYFRHRQYRIVSAVFGTLPCFFLVGMRLEEMLIASGVTIDNGNTYSFPLAVSYWMEVSIQICFILASSGIVILFRSFQIHSRKDRVVFVSAMIDIAICTACLVVLMVAESRRCCSGSHDDEYPLEKVHAREMAEKGYTDHIIECCPRWGSRAYGGVGNLEPFTSIICLRIFRFWIAEKLVRYLETINDMHNPSALEPSAGECVFESNTQLHAFDPRFDKKKHHDEHHNTLNFRNETGTLVELWKVALGLYPDIVEKHGEFSSELLQTMLGIDVPESAHFSAPMQAIEPTGNGQRKEESFKVPNIIQPIASHGRPSQLQHRQLSDGTQTYSSPIVNGRKGVVNADMRYSGLAPEAQAIILSGKVGHNVSARDLGGPNNVGGQRLRRILTHEFGTSLDNVVENVAMDSSVQMSQVPAFEIINEVEAQDEQFLSQFVAPNARLLRSMRRCDKKLFPLFNTWTAVDVVMTRYEIVYFDVADIDDISSVMNPSASAQRMQSLRQALIATKGGKGLRLRDVAFGRRIIGRLELSLVESLHVVRVLPHEGMILPNNDLECVADEFWRPKDASKADETGYDVVSNESRDDRWAKLKEDRLKIQTKHDTLYLRFYSDLDNMEHHVDRVMSEGEAEGPIFKNNAYQWCQTIARLCGSEQLNQRMPHFGDDNYDELRDFLLVVDVDGLDPSKQKKGVVFRLNRLRKAKASKDFPHHHDDESEPTPSELKKIAFHRSRSFGEALATSNDRTTRLKSLLRLTSADDNDDEGGNLRETKSNHRRHHTLSADFDGQGGA